MRKCKDCEREYEDAFVGTKTQLCKICYNRYKNSHYLKKEYIKIKDLPLIEQEKVIEGCMKKRTTLGKHKKAVKETVTLKKTCQVKEDNIDVNQVLAVVKNDIDLAFEKANINQDYLKLTDLPQIIEDLFLIMVDGKTVDNMKTAEDVFNNIKSDYDHLMEHTSEKELGKIAEVGMMQKLLCDLRRPTKMIVTYYRILEPVISKIKQYPILVKEIENTNKRLNGLRHKYLVKASTAVMEMVKQSDDYEDMELQEDLTPTFKNKKHFNWRVDCFNLYGNPNKSLFVSENGVWADDITDAKFRIRKFLEEKFSNVTYMEKDLIIEEDFSND